MKKRVACGAPAAKTAAPSSARQMSFAHSREELKVWADRLQSAAPKRIWAYFNNDREGYAIKNAQMLIRLLKRRCL